MSKISKNNNLSAPAGHLPKLGEINNVFSIGCHVSAAGGVWNAPKNASELECETFQIFTRPPMGGPAPKIDAEAIEKFKIELEKYYPSPQPSPAPPSLKLLRTRRGEGGSAVEFVVHAPYIVNFGSGKMPTYHGSISIVSEELKRANSLGAKYVMTHLGSFKDLGPIEGMKQAKEGLKQVLEKYEGSDATIGVNSTKFLLEISAGAGEVIGDTFEELVELMEKLVKFKTFGGICFDTQHAFSAGYDLRNSQAVTETFKQFDKVIGLKWLKMSHINDSKVDFGGKKDRHEHIGEGKIGEAGFKAMMQYLSENIPSLSTHRSGGSLLSRKGETNKVAFGSFPLILETEHDKVESDIKILKKIRNNLKK